MASDRLEGFPNKQTNIALSQERMASNAGSFTLAQGARNPNSIWMRKRNSWIFATKLGQKRNHAASPSVSAARRGVPNFVAHEELARACRDAWETAGIDWFAALKIGKARPRSKARSNQATCTSASDAMDIKYIKIRLPQISVDGHCLRTLWRLSLSHVAPKMSLVKTPLPPR